MFVVVWGFGAFFFLFACFVTGGERISLGNPLCQNRKKPSGKKNKKPTEFCGVLSLIFSLVFHLHMHEEGAYNGKLYFLSKIWIWHPVLIITSSDYKLCRF